jgi:hypothetical protein
MEDQESPAPRLEWCPGCGSGNILPVVARDTANFLCRECGCCWHPDGNRFRAVDPRACPGCPSQPVCIRRLWEGIEWVGPAGGHDLGDAARPDLWS